MLLILLQDAMPRLRASAMTQFLLSIHDQSGFREPRSLSKSACELVTCVLVICLLLWSLVQAKQSGSGLYSGLDKHTA